MSSLLSSSRSHPPDREAVRTSLRSACCSRSKLTSATPATSADAADAAAAGAAAVPFVSFVARVSLRTVCKLTIRAVDRAAVGDDGLAHPLGWCQLARMRELTSVSAFTTTDGEWMTEDWTTRVKCPSTLLSDRPSPRTWFPCRSAPSPHARLTRLTGT